ncbi:hypothetical protein Salat_2574900 [Sesamum alatum]|uniref:Uncharacterized protein n=1 Tax=Sesamum alatum TaxID=300844 RepID=A0AAE1XTT4_9LAMI|nr:hypothetical protein Salat_2574900 [Sesamum alatum]
MLAAYCGQKDKATPYLLGRGKEALTGAGYQVEVAPRLRLLQVGVQSTQLTSAAILLCWCLRHPRVRVVLEGLVSHHASKFLHLKSSLLFWAFLKCPINPFDSECDSSNAESDAEMRLREVMRKGRETIEMNIVLTRKRKTMKAKKNLARLMPRTKASPMIRTRVMMMIVMGTKKPSMGGTRLTIPKSRRRRICSPPWSGPHCVIIPRLSFAIASVAVKIGGSSPYYLKITNC